MTNSFKVRNIQDEELKLTLNNQTRLILVLLARWSNLTSEHLATLLSISDREIRALITTLEPYEYETKPNSLDLIIFKQYGFTKIYAISNHGMKLLGQEFVKKKGSGNQSNLFSKRREVWVPLYQLKFNPYELDHTTLCIRKLQDLIGENVERSYYVKGSTQEYKKTILVINHEHYFTGRELAVKWKNLFPKIKTMWNTMSKQIEERKPDLLIDKKDGSPRIAVEIEHTKKTTQRMKTILHSLFAIGSYMHQFEKLIIYANDKNIIYSNWLKLVKIVPPGYRPKDTEIRPLYDLEKLEK